MSYATERDAAVRTPQAILTIGVPRCENFYAQTRKQHLTYTEDFSNAIWTLLGGATRSGAVNPCPREGEFAGGHLNIPANGDGIEQISDQAAAGRAFTFTIFLANGAASGIRTVTLQVADGGAESATLQVSVPAAWTRFTLHKLFTGGAAGNVRVRVKGVTGDTVLGAFVILFGANLTENLSALDLPVPLAYVKRTNEADTVLATMASRCQAADAGDGSRCTFVGNGCQDPANYNPGNYWNYPTWTTLPPDSTGDPKNGIREYKFCLKGAPLPFTGGTLIRPQLVDYDQAPQEIDGTRGGLDKDSHGGFITKREEVTYRLEDDADPGVWDLEKSSIGGLINTAKGSGSFWRRFLANHPNFDNPRGYAKLVTGYVFAGSTEADYVTRLSGPILNIKVSNGGIANVLATDGLQLTKRKIPSAISTGNLLDGSITSGATSISVDDPTEISDPAPNAADAETFDSGGARSGGPDWQVVLQFGTEKMTLLAKTAGGNPLTVRRGRWGTSAIAHSDNEAFTEIREFGTEQVTPGNPVLGANPIDIKLALYREAGLRWAGPNSEHLGIDIEFHMAQRQTWAYSNVDTLFGGQGGVLFRQTITEPTDIDQLLQEIDRDLVSYQFVSENRKVRTKIFAPPTPSETLIELTDVTHFVDGSVEVDTDQESRLSRVIVGWDQIPGTGGDVFGDYAKGALALDPVQEGPLGHGSIKDRIILSKWIRPSDSAQGAATAGRILRRFLNGARIVTGSLEAKDDDNVTLGTFVYVTTAQIQKPDGSTDGKKIMMVVRKERAKDGGRMALTFLDTAILKRSIFFGPAGNPDYSAATAEQQRYWYIGNSQNRVGTPLVDGYYIP